jgi:hypothetical protein
MVAISHTHYVRQHTPNLNKMTEIQKASAWFHLNGIKNNINDDQLYVIIMDTFSVMVSNSEILYRAELHDEETSKL